ncbi:MAG: cell wall hydrolase, partial [Lachnospiraceae bacterium]
MKDGRIFLRKVRTAALAIAMLITVTGIGIGYGRQSFGREALAAKSTEKESRTEAKKSTVEFQLEYLNQPFGEQPSGSLLKAAVYKVVGMNPTAEAKAEEVYDEVTTHALARDAMETLEQETLELMASPAGSVWGGRIKVYAGDTPLIITEEDKEVLLRIVEAEATCEDIKGRMLVANVILNRVVSEDFPDSITEVVFQNNGVTYQFS